jgi:hypothetical protein
MLSLRLSHIRKERFNQPLFGASNMTGKCAVDNGDELSWKLAFYSGGSSTFLMTITRLLKDIRRQRASGAEVSEWRKEKKWVGR